MNSNLIGIFILLIFIGCHKNAESGDGGEAERLTSRVQIRSSHDVYYIKSGKFEYDFSREQLPANRVIVLNASLIGYLAELGLEEKIVGVSSPEYIYSEKIQQLVSNEKIHNVGNEQKYNLEKIVALKPDLIITNHISTFENTYDALRKMTSAKILFLDEYLETHPLDQSRYLLIFGELFGKKAEAQQKFKLIDKNYQQWSALARKQQQKPVVIANEIYGNQWFMPGGKTQFAQFIKDAGGAYLLEKNDSEKAVPLSFEEILVQSGNSKIWLNAGNHQSKAGLLQINPNYAELNAFRNGSIYSVALKQKN